MTNKPPQGLSLEVLIGIAHANPTAPPHASKLMAHKDKLKNVTPKVPVQSIDFWCNDGADEPWEEKHDS